MNQSVLSLTKKLISISSESGQEAAALSFIANWLKQNGFYEPKLSDQFCAAKIPGQNGTVAVILCGHVDTVTAGDLSEWRQSPVQPVQVKDKLYGLGSSDMKAGLAAQMMATRAFIKAKPPVDIWLVAVASEEVDGSGAEAFVNWFKVHHQYEKTYCLIAEPTDLTRLETGHRGNRFVELTFKGLAGHGSQPVNYPLSALAAAQRFLIALPMLTKKFEKFSDELLGSPSIVPTALQTGSLKTPNKLGQTAYLALDIRTTPKFESVLESWLTITANSNNFSWRYLANPQPFSLCNENSKIVKALKKATGISQLSVSYGATDQTIFQAQGIETVVFGPGEFASAHQQNEYVRISKIAKAVDIYIKVINSFSI